MKRALILIFACSLPAYGAVRRSPEVVAVPGIGNLRAVVSTPAGHGPHPALFVVGWLSCDSVNAVDPADAFLQFLNEIEERSGMVVMRVDKPGVGGSDGDCAATDFVIELEGYRAAWRQLAKRSDVDPSRMFVLGLSNGGGVAPLVPTTPAAAGFVSIGGWARTWFEHMLDLERRRMALAGVAPAEVSTRMKAVASFYTKYLIERRSPAEILRTAPELRVAWEGDTARQYGRPPQFFQQLQELNLAAAWSEVRVPTLVVHGANDWIMDRDDQEAIVTAVNKQRPGLATFVVLDRMDHFFRNHPSMQDGFAATKPAPFASESVRVVAKWLRRQR